MTAEIIQEALPIFASNPNTIEACHYLLQKCFGFSYLPGSPARTFRTRKYLEHGFVEKNEELCEKCPFFGYLGMANQAALMVSNPGTITLQQAEIEQGGMNFEGMSFYCIETSESLNRTDIAQLTRAFSKGTDTPVVLFIRNGKHLTISTCERSVYVQSGHERDGFKVGRKVSILSNINCEKPHRGHIDILVSLNVSGFQTFNEVYTHWLDALSNELLTKRFYSELSDWYAWALQTTRFPNGALMSARDDKANNESCIRLITRLIFVWFLKRKNLIPKEFFDEKDIRNTFIANFNPDQKNDTLYNSEESKYYRLILQNLFFAMLNCPIVAEGSNVANNRRFFKFTQKGNSQENDGTSFMHYEREFKEGGAIKFLKLANNNVPFLNGGLFECQDKPSESLYYDGFSEECLNRLFVPDYLFFGDKVGKNVDLTNWYGYKKKKDVRGIINILNSYTFTVEENTPLDQEVSLDPELLGKVFENLLASVDPVTHETAREKTGSYYTPREVVQYMVDESLVAYLRRTCGGELEHVYRCLVNYTTDDPNLSLEQRKSILEALYNCRVLDPACGSGAFPVGMLQQMVHILKRIDPKNEMWNTMMLDMAIKETQNELNKAASDEQQRKKIQEHHADRLNDIKNAFDQSINYPDYARKLYLIEHCIFGADILPIATQISKLRFFISLVVDQKKNDNSNENFGIRPLPNLEANFVTADSLVPLNRVGGVITSEAIIMYEEDLREISHRIFSAKRRTEKNELRDKTQSIRMMMAQTLQNLGMIEDEGYHQLLSWDPFDQNSVAPFFDAEWMFGIQGGFDIYIGNPPYKGISDNNGCYIRQLIEDYKKEPGPGNRPLRERKLWLQDDYVKFIRIIEDYIESRPHGILAFINNSSFIDNPTFRGMRWHLLNHFNRITILDLHGNSRKNNVSSDDGRDENVFNIMQGVSINIFLKDGAISAGRPANVSYCGITGPRKKKLSLLSNAAYCRLDYDEVAPVNPFYLFRPQSMVGIHAYDEGFSIPSLMPVNVTGVVTARDGLVIDMDREALLEKIRFFTDPDKSDTEVRDYFFGKKKSSKYLPGDSRGWSLSAARERIRNKDHESMILSLAFRILDDRYIYYSSDMVDWSREEIYRHVIGKDNVCLVVPRQTSKEWRHVFVTDRVANFNFLATGGQNGAGTHFPLYTYKADGTRVPNLDKAIWEKINVSAKGTHSPEEVLDYIYGILHSNSYRTAYMEFLRGDFPKIPYPQGQSDFEHYSSLGKQLRALHLLKGIPSNFPFGEYKGEGDGIVRRVAFVDSKVIINRNQFFDCVPEEVWQFRIGDDYPAQRWLKERKDRKLTVDDIRHYRCILFLLNETIRLMNEIDNHHD